MKKVQIKQKLLGWLHRICNNPKRRIDLLVIELMERLDSFVFQTVHSHVMAAEKVIDVHPAPVIIGEVDRIPVAACEILSQHRHGFVPPKMRAL